MVMRLQKFLSECGVASRRKAEEFIVDGRVTVNGEVINTLGAKVDTKQDTVCFDGKIVRQQHFNVYIMLHKPKGYVTTVSDQFDRPTVMDLVKDIDVRLYPVGRLDFDTSGLLLMTNDGELAYRLTHPKFEIKKIYDVRVKGHLSKEDISRLENGVEIDGKMTAPAKVKVVKEYPDASVLRVIIHEGRNRQVRKMIAAVEHELISLKRVQTGELALGDLPLGEYRYLTDEEVNYIKKM